MKSLQWTRKNSSDPKLALIFDNRPHREEANKRVFSIYQRHFASGEAGPPEPSITFESSQCFLPLQGADVIAWELYQRGKDWLAHGPKTPFSDNLKRLIASGKIDAEIGTREVIEKIVAQPVNPKFGKILADFIEGPIIDLPPSKVAAAGEARLRLDPILSARSQWFPDLPQKQWSPSDPSQGITPWPDRPLLELVIPISPRSEENSEDGQT